MLAQIGIAGRYAQSDDEAYTPNDKLGYARHGATALVLPSEMITKLRSVAAEYYNYIVKLQEECFFVRARTTTQSARQRRVRQHTAHAHKKEKKERERESKEARSRQQQC